MDLLHRNIGRDIVLLVIIFAIALLLRLPGLDSPNKTEFDESVYVNFAVMTQKHIPFFDIHPPFAKLLMYEVAHDFSYLRGTTTASGMQPFGDFPYVPIRRLVALFGVLLPLFVYGIGRLLGYRALLAAIPAILVVFDNALIIYSRVMLPDMILLTLGFGGLFFSLATSKTKGVYGFIFAFLSALLFGAAVSVKWTALGIIIVAVVLLVHKQKWKELFIVAILVPFVYLLNFVVFFNHFPTGGKIAPLNEVFTSAWVTDVSFPKSTNLADQLVFTGTLHNMILRANTDQDATKNVFKATAITNWPTGKSGIMFWYRDDKKATIQLYGNIAVWTLTFLLLIYILTKTLITTVLNKKWPLAFFESLLIFGYVLNFLTFFLIDRPTYLYHYFTSLIFLFLQVPMFLPQIKKDLNKFFDDSYLTNLFFWGGALLCVLYFILLLPITYGL